MGSNEKQSTTLEVPVQGQSLVKTDQSLVQSLVLKNVNFGGSISEKVVIFFYQTLQG